jgi:hypothetical protein
MLAKSQRSIAGMSREELVVKIGKMRSRERKCYIHIGTHKTGTSSLQTFLGTNRERFAANGVLLPRSGTYGNLARIAHHELVRDLMGAPMLNPANGGLDAVADELRSSDARVACLSSEDLSFLWDNTSALVRLRDAVSAAGFQPHIVVYLRPQVSYCTAVYAESVRQGYRTGFRAYLTDVLRRGHWIWNGSHGPPFDYHEMLAPFDAVFGAESIMARVYRPAARDEDIYTDFTRLLVPANVNIAGYAIPLGRENRSLDFGTILELLGEERAIDETLRFAPLNVIQLFRLWRRFRRANSEVAARYSITLPVLDARDMALALPFRRTLAKTLALAAGRRALSRVGKKRTRVCYIHIGTHKTGTTSIQAFLAENPRRFIDNGVFLPVAGREDDLGVVAHHELAKDLLGNPLFKPERGGLEAVVEELRNAVSDAACLTSEDFSFLYNMPQALIRLRDGVRSAGYEPHVVVYLRAQASYSTAVYAENVRHGYRVPFDQYLTDVLNRGCYVWNGGSGPPFDYTQLLDGFAAVFGAEAITARPYRSGAPDNALLFSFARLLSPQADFEKFRVPPIRHNGSLNFAAVLKLLGVASNVNESIRFTPLDLVKTLRIGAHFALPNLRLARRYGVVVPPFERIDVALALPWRKTRAKTIALARARTLLAAVGGDRAQSAPQSEKSPDAVSS